MFETDRLHKKAYHDRHSHARELRVGQSVWAKNFREGPAWVPARVSDQVGPLSFLVQLSDGGLWRRHIDHLRAGCDQPPEGVTCTSQLSEGTEDEFTPVECTDTGTPHHSNAGETLAATPLTEHAPTEEQSHATESNTSESHAPSHPNESVQPTDTNISRRYPTRQRKPPDRLS